MLSKKKSKVSQKGKRDAVSGWGMSRKLWRGEKFHPMEIHLTQEEQEAKIDIVTERKPEKESEKCSSM